MQILPKQNVTDGNIPTLNPIYYCTISPSVLLFPTFIFSLLVDENMNSKSFFFFQKLYTYQFFIPQSRGSQRCWVTGMRSPVRCTVRKKQPCSRCTWVLGRSMPLLSETGVLCLLPQQWLPPPRTHIPLSHFIFSP